MSSPTPVKTWAKGTLGNKWNPWGIILCLPADHSEARTMPYSSVGPPFPLCFRGPSISPAGLDRWHSLSRHSSFLLCSFHLACPAYFQSWFGHLFYQSLLTRVHTCSKQPAPGPNWMLPQRTGYHPYHWANISFSSLSPLLHCSLALLGTHQSSSSFLFEMPACFLTKSLRLLGLNSSTWVS